MDRIAVVQDFCFPGAKAGNLAKAGRWVAEAAGQGAQLVLFPELYLTGFGFEGPTAPGLAENLDGAAMDFLKTLAHRHRLWILMGFPERDPVSGRVFNSLVCLTDQGAVAGCYRKVHLFDREQAVFDRGDASVVIDTPLGRAGLLICYDIEFPELARCLALQDARLLLVASANMVPWCPQQEIFARARAAENQVFLALANRVGQEAGFRFCGRSICVDPWGRVTARANARGPQLLVAELAPEHGRPPQGAAVDYLRDRRPEVYAALSVALQTRRLTAIASGSPAADFVAATETQTSRSQTEEGET